MARIDSDTEPFLRRIEGTFQQYTDHGPEHSDRIIELLFDVILDEANLLYLEKRPWTHFFLLAAARLHDIGMVDWEEFHVEGEKPPSTEEIRRAHGRRAADILLANPGRLGLKNKHQARIVAEIVEHHTGDLTRENLRSRLTYMHESVGVGWCTAMIRLADELDLPGRTDERLSEFITDKTSQAEWRKHYSVAGVAAHPDLKRTILVSCECEDDEVRGGLRALESKINHLIYEISTSVESGLQFVQCKFEFLSDGRAVIGSNAAHRKVSSGSILALETASTEGRVPAGRSSSVPAALSADDVNGDRCLDPRRPHFGRDEATVPLVPGTASSVRMTTHRVCAGCGRASIDANRERLRIGWAEGAACPLEEELSTHSAATWSSSAGWTGPAGWLDRIVNQCWMDDAWAEDPPV